MSEFQYYIVGHVVVSVCCSEETVATQYLSE